MSNGNQAKRLPREGECQEDSEGDILESASTFAYRDLKEIEALAGTTTCKSVKLVRLKQWAQEQGRWFDDRTQFGDFSIVVLKTKFIYLTTVLKSLS